MNFLLFNIISLLWTLYVRFPIVMIDFEMIWVLRDVTETNRDLRKNIKSLVFLRRVPQAVTFFSQ